MKPFLPLLPIVLLFSKCQPATTVSSVTGTYTRVEETAVYLLYDTIVFSSIPRTADGNILVDRRTSTRFRKREDQPLNKNNQYTLTGVFDTASQTLQTPDPGIVYHFDRATKTVTLNQIRYTKTD